ncbi:hypothetical protein BD410DRAFT_847303, partial [Rickenella mellea]
MARKLSGDSLENSDASKVRFPTTIDMQASSATTSHPTTSSSSSRPTKRARIGGGGDEFGFLDLQAAEAGDKGDESSEDELPEERDFIDDDDIRHSSTQRNAPRMLTHPANEAELEDESARQIAERIRREHGKRREIVDDVDVSDFHGEDHIADLVAAIVPWQTFRMAVAEGAAQRAARVVTERAAAKNLAIEVFA